MSSPASVFCRVSLRSGRKLSHALGKAVSERRITVWIALPDELRLTKSTPLAHAAPDDAAPLANVVINNHCGHKIDHHLRRETEYVETRKSTLTVRLENTLPNSPQLSDYVMGAEHLVSNVPFDAPKGTMITSVRLLGMINASLGSGLANGHRVPVIERSEHGHPSCEVKVRTPSGKAGEPVFRLSELRPPGAPRVQLSPWWTA